MPAGKSPRRLATCETTTCKRRRNGFFTGEPVQARLQRSAIATSPRNASFTHFESGKAATRSGSRRTTFVLRRYASVHTPRTPVEKSYSDLISLVRRFVGGFFVVGSFMFRCRACADEGRTPRLSNRNDSNRAACKHCKGHRQSSPSNFAARFWDWSKVASGHPDRRASSI